MAGERAPTIFPEMVIRWQPILGKLLGEVERADKKPA